MMDAEQVPVCRHFVNGSCRFGVNCIYRHELQSYSSAQVCRYFQKGGCWFGERCRYRHVITTRGATASSGRSSAPTVSSSAASPSGQMVLLAEVLRGSQVPATQSNAETNHSRVQGGLAQEQSQAAPASSRLLLESEKDSKTLSPEEGAAASSTHGVTEVPQSQDLTCGVCMDKVNEKLDPRHQMFGILPNCTHVFCLQCIMTWRKTKDLGSDLVKTCPQCRVRSPFYVPNKHWVEGAAKERLITSFKAKFSKKSCCYYSRYGCCPFKTDCLYRHDKRGNHQTLQFISDYEDEEFFDLINFVMMSLFDDDLDVFESDDFDI